MSSPLANEAPLNDSTCLLKSAGDGSAAVVACQADKRAMPLEPTEESRRRLGRDYLPPGGKDHSGIPVESSNEQTTWNDGPPPLKKRQVEESALAVEEIRLLMKSEGDLSGTPAKLASENSAVEVKLGEEDGGLSPDILGDVHPGIERENRSDLRSLRDGDFIRFECPTGEKSAFLEKTRAGKYRVPESAPDQCGRSKTEDECMNSPSSEDETSSAGNAAEDRCAHFREIGDDETFGNPEETISKCSVLADQGAGKPVILLDEDDEDAAAIEKGDNEISRLQGTSTTGDAFLPDQSIGGSFETPGNPQDESFLFREDSEDEDSDFAAALLRRELEDEDFDGSEGLQGEASVVVLGEGDDSRIFIQFQDGKREAASFLFRPGEGREGPPWFPAFVPHQHLATPPDTRPEHAADPQDFDLESSTEPSGETSVQRPSHSSATKLDYSAGPPNPQPESIARGTRPGTSAQQAHTRNRGEDDPLNSQRGISTATLDLQPGSSATTWSMPRHTSAATLDTQSEFSGFPQRLHPHSQSAMLRTQSEGSLDSQQGASSDLLSAEGGQGGATAAEGGTPAPQHGDGSILTPQSRNSWRQGAFRRLLITMDDYFPYRLRHMGHPVVRAYSLLDTGLARQAQQGETTLVPWCRELLAREGVDIDHVVQEGTLKGVYLLGVACQLGNCPVVKLLLDSGANVNPTSDMVGETPLHVAAFHGHRDVVALLLSRGARADDKCMSSFAALQLALENGHSDCALLLIEAGATVKLAPSFHNSPLPNLVLTLLLQVSTRALDAHHLLFRLYQRLCEPSFLVMPTLKTRSCNRSRATIVDEVLRAGVLPCGYQVSEDDKDLLLLHTKGSRDIMYKLACIGFNFYSQDWADGLEQDLEEAGGFPEDCRELLKFLRATGSSPPCLKQCCRLAIRQTLLQRRRCQLHLDHLIETFPLPDFLKDFLKFKAGGAACFYVPD